jgi:hypothetical protein
MVKKFFMPSKFFFALSNQLRKEMKNDQKLTVSKASPFPIKVDESISNYSTSLMTHSQDDEKACGPIVQI